MPPSGLYLPYTVYRKASAFSASEIDEFFSSDDRTGTAGPDDDDGTFALWSQQLEGDIEDKLRLRYAVPFDKDAPPKVLRHWITALLDERVQKARRYPGDNNDADGDVNREADRARAAVDGAADVDKPSHHELPLRSDTSESAAIKMGPTAVATHPTIYGHFDAQAERRDSNGW